MNQPHLSPSTSRAELHALQDALLPGVATNRNRNSLSVEQQVALLNTIDDAQFNQAQRLAVEHVNGPLLVLAGAGSGKTHVVTHRIARLIGLGVRPRRILAVTFTNKATREMKERCSALLGKGSGIHPSISTLHSLALKIVKLHSAQLGYPGNIRIASDIDKMRFLKLAADNLPFDTLAQLGKDPVADLEKQISDWKNTLLGPRDIALKDKEARKALSTYLETNASGPPPDNPYAIADAYVYYQRWLQRSAMVDVDDLIRMAVAILESASDDHKILKSWQNRYDYILVDEFQDVNLAQARLLQLLAEKHQNICVVGDDDQSIYGWRAARVELIRNFTTEWPGATQVTLTRNYRCSPEILTLANTLIANEIGRKEKVLDAVSPQGTPPSLTVFGNEYDEATWIADSINQFQSTAILVRDRYRMEAISTALAKQKKPFEIWASDERPMSETKRCAYALLATLHHPVEESHGLIDLLDSSPLAVSSKDLEIILNSVDTGKSPSLWHSLSEKRIHNLSKAGEEHTTKLLEIVSAFHAKTTSLSRKESLATICAMALTALFPDHYGKEELLKDDQIAWKKAMLLQEVQSHVVSWEKSAVHKSFKSFLGWSERIRQRAKEPQRKQGDFIVLATYHAAKGLEFDRVFLPCLVQGVIPHKKALESFDTSGQSREVDEERRLFYVGLTRARRELYLSWSVQGAKRSGKNGQEPSIFIAESGANVLYDQDNVKAHVNARQRSLF